MMRLVIWWLHRQYKKTGMPIYYIKGIGTDYSKYLLYTEDRSIYERMDQF